MAKDALKNSMMLRDIIMLHFPDEQFRLYEIQAVVGDRLTIRELKAALNDLEDSGDLMSQGVVTKLYTNLCPFV
jgi:hypothetical protein